MYATRSAVEADSIGGAFVNDRRLVNVVNNGLIDVRHSGVVEVVVASPVAAIKPATGIAESIVNATVEPNCWAPIADVPHVEAVRKSPISRRPKQTDPRAEHPNAGHPVVALVAISPVARFPDVAGTWTNRLHVYRKEGRSNADRNNEAYG
jgi:hypothetical protein